MRRASVSSDDYTPLQADSQVNLGVLTDPYSLSSLLTGHFDLNLLREHIAVGLSVGLEGSYVRLVEASLVTYELLPSFEELGEDVFCQIEERVRQYIV